MYLSYIATNFFRDNGMLSVKYLRESNPPLYESKINTIHQMASSIIQSYDALVIAGR